MRMLLGMVILADHADAPALDAQEAAQVQLYLEMFYELLKKHAVGEDKLGLHTREVSLKLIGVINH